MERTSVNDNKKASCHQAAQNEKLKSPENQYPAKIAIAVRIARLPDARYAHIVRTMQNRISPIMTTNPKIPISANNSRGQL